MAHVGEPDHFVVGYEHLLSNLEKHLRELCSFLDVRYKRSIVSNYANTTKKIVSRSERQKDKSRGPLKDARLEKYLGTFDEAERLKIE